MKTLLNAFESKAPEIVFEWHDAETPARAAKSDRDIG